MYHMPQCVASRQRLYPYDGSVFYSIGQSSGAFGMAHGLMIKLYDSGQQLGCEDNLLLAILAKTYQFGIPVKLFREPFRILVWQRHHSFAAVLILFECLEMEWHSAVFVEDWCLKEAISFGCAGIVSREQFRVVQQTFSKLHIILQ